MLETPLAPRVIDRRPSARGGTTTTKIMEIKHEQRPHHLHARAAGGTPMETTTTERQLHLDLHLPRPRRRLSEPAALPPLRRP